MVLRVEQLVYRHAPGARAVLDGVSLSLNAGQIVCLLGPNGAGKTTLLRCLIGRLKPERGSVALFGQTQLSARERARMLAYVPQAGTGNGLSLMDIALMGRTPHLRPLAMPGARDRKLALDALERVGIAHLAAHPFERASGGERQLALIARALAQQPQMFVMDEPTASLDLGNQARVLACLRALADDGLALLVASHQPEHALLLEADVVALHAGSIRASGRADEVLHAPLLSELYGTAIELVTRNGRAAACVPTLVQAA